MDFKLSGKKKGEFYIVCYETISTSGPVKLIVETITLRLGRRASHFAAARDNLEVSQLDPACLMIELVLLRNNLGKILLAEAFAGEEVHNRNEDTDHMQALWEVGHKFVAHAVIDSFVTNEARHIDERFNNPRSRESGGGGVDSGQH